MRKSGGLANKTRYPKGFPDLHQTSGLAPLKVSGRKKRITGAKRRGKRGSYT